jgi:hypothetical protein
MLILGQILIAISGALLLIGLISLCIWILIKTWQLRDYKEFFSFIFILVCIVCLISGEVIICVYHKPLSKVEIKNVKIK